MTSGYDKLKEKYQDLIPRTLESNKNLLIESFVQYYGEGHRNRIEERYHQITLAYYIDWNLLKEIVEGLGLQNSVSRSFSLGSSSKERCSDLVQLYQDHYPKKSFFTKLFQKSVCMEESLEYVGCTGENLLENWELITEILECSDPKCFSYGDQKIVSFPILLCPDSVIIHELHHALTSEWMVDVSDGSIEKSGLEISSNDVVDDEVIEELLNEKASQEITAIFHQKGGDFSSFCLDIPYFKPYEENFYLIDSFYREFRPFIKCARITENKNALVERVGKDVYQRYVQFVEENYAEEKSAIEKRKKSSGPQLKALMQEMRDNVEKTPAFSQQELDQYYEWLRREGHTVTMLNQLDSNTDFSQKENSSRRR